MSDLDAMRIEAAIDAWSLQGHRCKLFAARENRIYRVSEQRSTSVGRAAKSWALRLHRLGYVSDSELSSELNWMAYLHASGMRVPEPLPLANGGLLMNVSGVNIDCLDWLPGIALSECFNTSTREELCHIYANIGRQMARLHTLSDAWALPNGFERRAWDKDGLVGENPVWGSFWLHPALSPAQRTLLLALRRQATVELESTLLDYGLIHADLVRENVMVDQGDISFIDFDDSGFGYRLFDLATTLVKAQTSPYYADLKRALLAGYGEVRTIDLKQLALLIALRAATYVGWIAQRAEESESESKSLRYIHQACELAENYLAAHR